MTVLHDKSVVSPILAGRSAEIRALQLATERAKASKGQTVFISGSGGIGKSRLVTEVISFAVQGGFLHLQGNCFEPDTVRPYAPLYDLLQTANLSGISADRHGDVVQIRDSLLAELSRSYGVVAADRDPEQQKQRLFDKLRQFFVGLATHQPLVLVIEDIHWSDETSLEFLYHLGRQSSTQSILLLLTYRNNEISPQLSRWLIQFNRLHLAQEIRLEPLHYNEVRAMLRAIFAEGPAASPEFANRLHALTDGNPFFVEEVLKALMAAGALFCRDGIWDTRPDNEFSIPSSIQETVRGRFEHLNETAKHVISMAAVIGRRFDFELLQTLTELDEMPLLDAMKALVSAQLVAEESPDQFTFRHALARQAIYSALLTRERKKLHQRIVQVLENRLSRVATTLADLAYHAYEAGDWTRALNYSLTAGEQAQLFYAPQSAIDHYVRAQQAAHLLAVNPPIQLFQARGLAYEAVGAFQPAQADLELALQMARLANDRQAEWQILLDLGMLWAGQDYAKTGQYYEDAFELARRINDPAAIGHSLNRVGNWHLNVEQPADAHWYHQEALTIFEKLGDTHGVAETLDLLGMASYLGGNLRQGTDYYRRAVDLFRALNDQRGLVSSLATLAIRGPTYQSDILNSEYRLADAAVDGKAALQIARETGRRADEAYSAIFLSICLGAQGDYHLAFPLAKDALSIATEINHRQWITAANFALGAIHLDIFALDAAQQYLEQAFALAQNNGSLHWIHNSAGLLAMVYLEQHQVERAEALLKEMIDMAAPIRTLGHRLLWRAHTELVLHKGDAFSALAVLDRISSASNSSPADGASIRLLKLRGEALLLLDDYAASRAALNTAYETALTLGARPQQWRLLLSLARLNRNHKQQSPTENNLEQAQAMIEVLAANIPEQSLQTVFRNNTTALTSPYYKRTFGGLTQREREVALLLAQGKSNRQIAEQLVLGERTIETHVSNILSKLSFSSRSQVMAWVIEQQRLT